MARISRRQFIASSAATGLAGILPQGAWNAAAEHSSGARVSLKAVGDNHSGYQAHILFDGRHVARHSGEGEFSAFFQNGDRSLEDRVQHWRASSCTEREGQLRLAGECQLPNLKATILVQVEYQVVAPRVVRKQIRLHLADIYDLFYQVTNSLEPFEPPASFWSFDQLSCKGGPLHEYFPAAGFRSHDNVTVGLLTDSGYRNGWSRIIRRDGKPVKPAPHRIPDINLCYVCRENDREQRRFFLSQTFGEELVREKNQDTGAAVWLPEASNWHKRGDPGLEEHSGTTVLSLPDSQAGAIVPFSAKDSEIYSLCFKYRAKESFSVQLWDVNERFDKLQNLTLYNDRLPPSPEAWSEFSADIFTPSLLGTSAALYISMAESDQDTKAQRFQRPLKIELRDLQLRRVVTYLQPYHRLEMDRARQKTSFIFMDDEVPDTLRGYRLASQRYLADGLAFRGGDTEKVLYSDLMMLCWSAAPEYQHPMVAPSIWYSAAGEMYLRDSFFALNGIHNCELNEGVFNLWASNQGEDGAINTLVEPYLANLERKSNDSTPLWLIWALRNRARFGTELPMDKIRKAAEYCLQTYDRRHDGVCWAQFVMGQLDVVNFPEGTSKICENQGILAVMLRVIKELKIAGISDGISDEYITKAEEVYQSYYDPMLKFVRPARDINDAIGFGEIFPEFLSLWLFGRKILTDEMLINHLDRIPLLLPSKTAPHPELDGTVRPIFIGLKKDGRGWDYFTDSWHPMISQEHGANYADHNMDGIYYNGGSWLRIEICGYVAGKLHGWNKADQAIANRLWAEINISPDFPTSQEYLATDPRHPFFGYHRVFAWNAFIFQALEIAALRKSEMDPDYHSA
ncbi:MAG: hypothetical protein WBV55_17820 [Candidatus Sulfotelmatobacter sp.]